MSDQDIAPVVARLGHRIGTITDPGRVWLHDIYDREDLARCIVSDIGGRPVLRAWWITGPRMDGRRLTHTDIGFIERDWVYEIHAVEGMSANGDSLLTLRDNCLAVSDAIDSEQTLNGTCHRTKPSRWRLAPENRVLWMGVACSYAVIEKTVTSVSTP